MIKRASVIPIAFDGQDTLYLSWHDGAIYSGDPNDDSVVSIKVDERLLDQLVRRAAANKRRQARVGPLTVKFRRDIQRGFFHSYQEFP